MSRLGQIIPAVLECTNCSRRGMWTVGGALSENVATVSLSTVPRLSQLSRQSCRLRVGKQTRRRGPVVWMTGLTCRAFTQSNDAGILTTIAALSRGSEVPRKTVKNTIEHRDGSVGSVVANHRSGSESLMVVATLACTNDRVNIEHNVHCQ